MRIITALIFSIIFCVPVFAEEQGIIINNEWDTNGTHYTPAGGGNKWRQDGTFMQKAAGGYIDTKTGRFIPSTK